MKIVTRHIPHTHTIYNIDKVSQFIDKHIIRAKNKLGIETVAMPSKFIKIIKCEIKINNDVIQ